MHVGGYACCLAVRRGDIENQFKYRRIARLVYIEIYMAETHIPQPKSLSSSAKKRINGGKAMANRKALASPPFIGKHHCMLLCYVQL